MTRLQDRYKEEVRPMLMKKFGFKNPMLAPRLEKVVVNIGVGDARENSRYLEKAVEELTAVTGQKAVVTKARKSIAGFKIRTGMPIGCFVTLRRERMYAFLDKLFSLALPRVRDFRGVSPRAFDGRGNYNLGVTEQLIFPEVDYDKVEKVRGMNIAIITSARNDVEGKALLQGLGLPLRAE